MKNRFLIHIGYPKTATTTLQHKIFYILHQKGMINFLGKTLIGFNNAEKLLDWVIRDRDIDLKKSIIKLDTKKVNVLSEELLSSTYDHYLEVNRKIKKLSIYDMAYKLYKIAENSNTSIVVVLRNQSDLIYSLYVQAYITHFRHFPDFNSPNKFINNLFNKNKKYSPFFEMFYFFEVINTYAEVFGKENIEILFYEDLVNKEEAYYKKWATLLGTEVEIIKELFENKENVKKEGSKGYIVEVDYGYILSEFIHRAGLIDLYSRLKKNKLFYRFSKRLFNLMKNKTKEKKEFEKFDEETRNKIKEFFREDTMKLIDKFNLDEQKMRKYGYI